VYPKIEKVLLSIWKKDPMKDDWPITGYSKSKKHYLTDLIELTKTMRNKIDPISISNKKIRKSLNKYHYRVLFAFYGLLYFGLWETWSKQRS